MLRTDGRATGNDPSILTPPKAAAIPALEGENARPLPPALEKVLKRVQFGPVQEIAIGKVYPYGEQPREHFDEAELKGLADSVKSVGQLQPGIVRSLGHGKYELIDGERRWRACQMAGKEFYRAQVVEGTRADIEKIKLLLSLVSNFGRQEHTAWEVAKSCQRLLDDHIEEAFDAEAVAAAIGKPVYFVERHLCLMKLHPTLQKLYSHPTNGKAPSLGIGEALARLDKRYQLRAYELIRTSGGGIAKAAEIVRQLKEQLTGKKAAPRTGGGRKAAALPAIDLSGADQGELSDLPEIKLPIGTGMPKNGQHSAGSANGTSHSTYVEPPEPELSPGDLEFTTDVDEDEVATSRKTFAGLRDALRGLVADKNLSGVSDAGRLALVGADALFDIIAKIKSDPTRFRRASPEQVHFAVGCIKELRGMVEQLSKLFPDLAEGSYILKGNPLWDQLKDEEDSPSSPPGHAKDEEVDLDALEFPNFEDFPG